ncbi:hypothetical protein [Lacinutrix salivirga]
MKTVFKIIPIVLFLCSCKSYKNKKADAFFNAWEVETENIVKQETENQLEKDIAEISKLVFCLETKQNIRYTNLKYKIVNKEIKVSLVEDLDSPDFKTFPAPYSLKTPKYIFKDSIFLNRPNCNEASLKLLILTDYYRKKINGKLKFGFGSFNQGKRLENARAILEREYSKKYKIPKELSKITFNKNRDSAVVGISVIFGYRLKRFIKVNNNWQFDKTLLELDE